MIKIKKSSIRIINNIFYAIVILLGILILLTKISFFNYLKIYTVMSGSMSPVIKTGALVVDYRSKNYSPKDIVTYQSDKAITHRIVSTFYYKGNVYYVTHGDANNNSNTTFIFKKQILGKVLFQIPYLGYIIGFGKTWPGLIMLIIIPATIITYHEILTLKSEIAYKRKNKTIKNKEVLNKF